MNSEGVLLKIGVYILLLIQHFLYETVEGTASYTTATCILGLHGHAYAKLHD